ncbi:reverse transcriptase/maturase family protein [Bacillus toyonensis]|uniref:Group II intron reverse transcriptase/maturase n=2 Tax=Bacillus cereus group TaxID=86661 RepID=A0AAP8JUQ4_9BACI|nr:reverse transcriptase/maturase family protein [Bacillus toyonensis]PEB90080.1 group II intron reverse transcriptase/maturase [Bacillus toyonensis]PHE05102.1 group II intron reverse transcriptase/maturase [Bacillus toyonensis]
MRNPEIVLGNLVKHSTDKNYKYMNVYRNLYNPLFYLNAYQNIYAKEGNMTIGTDNQTIDGMSMNRIQRIIEKMKDESYQPNPARRVYIPKKNGQRRALGIPAVDDKLVQEVLRNILESIFNPTFSNRSHGFRPNMSCHSALLQIKGSFTGCRWFVEGDIEKFFDNISHHVLIGILRKRIQDEKFIALIWKFLKAGYVEDWKYHKTYSGTPQGGVISPILANIYLNELDEYMEEFKKDFDIGKSKRTNPEYSQIQKEIRILNEQIQSEKQEKKQKELIKQRAEAIKSRDNMEAKLPVDKKYKRIQYVRYADDFLIGIIGSKQDAREIKENLTEFLRDKLKLTLSEEKTKITNTREKVRFLGYDIKIIKDNAVKRRADGRRTRPYKGKCELYMPTNSLYQRLMKKGIIQISQRTGKWKPMHRPELLKLDPIEVLRTYNAEIRGTYQYYQLAVNVCHLNSYKYFLEYSMYKTLANKYRTTLAKAKMKFMVEGVFTIFYETKKGLKSEILYNKGFQRRKTPINNGNINQFPNENQNMAKTSLIQRLTAYKCEWCSKETSDLEVHHVRKLKDLKGKKWWERQMIARQRKTMVLCKRCHVDLHMGKLD